MPTEGPCIKSSWAGRKAAQRAARKLREREKDFRAYRCERCGRWHLTTKPSRKALEGGNGRWKPGRRLRPGQTLEELCAEMTGRKT